MTAAPTPQAQPQAQPVPKAQRASRRQRNLAARVSASGAAGAGALSRAHETHEAISAIEIEPPHLPRKETPIYRATHKRLVVTEDRPCFVCGVRRSDLLSKARRNDPKINPYGAKVMESHHVIVERGLLMAIDRTLLAQAYPTVLQFKTLEEWVDSEHNVVPFCDRCHRLADHAIHRALWQDVIATKFAVRDATTGQRYEFAANASDAAATEAADEALVEREETQTAPAVAPAVVASGG